MKPLIVLEMNEVNFDYVQVYIRRGELKNFEKVFSKHGYCETSSETEYEILEPWIQWVSARTGKPFAEHRVFRLGDIVKADVRQHWEELEDKGYQVAAVSPINGANRTTKSPFWIADPWVDTTTSGGRFEKQLADAIKQAVNDNASARLSSSTRKALLRALITKSRISSWSSYLSGIRGVLKKQHWSKAIVLDRLLADVFFRLFDEHRPSFATLFLNSAAHIQHHYLFNSRAYEGGQKNPGWYVDAKADPVLEIYKLYDAILGEALKLDARVMVATALRQVPYEELTFYYRLVHHEGFLRQIGVSFDRVLPRMSRDFLIECANIGDAGRAAGQLAALRSADDTKLFSVDNRGDTLFVTLSYPHEIEEGFEVFDEKRGKLLNDFSKEVAFVAIKNGHHDSKGYFLDSDLEKGELPVSFALEELYPRVMSHFELA